MDRIGYCEGRTDLVELSKTARSLDMQVGNQDFYIDLLFYHRGLSAYEIAKVAQGDTVVHLYRSNLEALNLAISSSEEQQKIANCLSSLDALIAAHTEKLDALKTHKKGLMQQLFPIPEVVGREAGRGD